MEINEVMNKVVDNEEIRITKRQLESLKRQELEKGRDDIRSYILFSMKNYRYQLNFSGAIEVVKEIIDFASGNTDTIHNTYGYSFYDFINITN